MRRFSQGQSEQHYNTGETTANRASHPNDPAGQLRPTCVFDVFFDLPHPAASNDADRARMIEPPEVTNPAILAEVYEPSAIAKLCRFAFPEHDDQKHALELQAGIEASYHRKLERAFERRRSTNGSNYPNYADQNEQVLNKLDIYPLSFRSDRLTFTLVLSDGKTKLYGHTLRYLPNHKQARTRADVGRRGARAMVILTSAVGGDKFFTAILRSLVAVVIQAEAISSKVGYEDIARDRAMRVLHSLHKEQARTYSEAMMKLRNKESENLGDDHLVITSLEFDIDMRGFIQERVLPGDYIRMQIPASLQAGFRAGIAPDDIDIPILPLLRALGAANTVLIIVAVMCERRIVLVSSNASKLSSCVRALSSMLAQGLLTWRYSMVPVLPPHLFDFLMDKKPFLVGVLDDFLNDIKELDSLKESLCVHLDKNQFKTFAKEKPSALIPDVLLKSGKETAAHILYNDLQKIVKAEARTWGEAEKDDGIGPNSPPNDTAARRRKTKGRIILGDTDMPGLFNRVMRGEALDAPETYEFEQDALSAYPGGPTTDFFTRHDRNMGHSTISKFEICENERGEEGLRAAVTFFFLVTHGDLNSIISRSRDGTFLLDRKKYMLHKKKQGNREKSELFKLYKIFSGSAMLEHHLGQRIEEFNRGRSLLMPRHRSLFSLCEKHLRVNKTDFSYVKIREIVAGTSEHSPLHAHVQSSELARARALTLTSAEEFDGNVSSSLFLLLKNCHLCDSVLPQTIAVIWERLSDKNPSDWKHPLLGLHLLKNLLLHGPISIISYALDGLDKIQKLRSYDIASKEESNKEVKESAEVVWQLIVNSSGLLLQRQQKQAARAKFIDSKIDQRWGSYLLKKVPFSTDFRQYHTILRPRPSHIPAFMMPNRTGPTNPRDAPFIGKDVEDMAIVRMELTPRTDSGQQQRRISDTAQGKKGHFNEFDTHATPATYASTIPELSSTNDVDHQPRNFANERQQRSMNSAQKRSQLRTGRPNTNTQRRDLTNGGQHRNGVADSGIRKGRVSSVGNPGNFTSRQPQESAKPGRTDPRLSQRREHANGRNDARSIASRSLNSGQMPHQPSARMGPTHGRQVQHAVRNSNASVRSGNSRASYQAEIPMEINASSQMRGAQSRDGNAKMGNGTARYNGSHSQSMQKHEDLNNPSRSKESSRRSKSHPHPSKASQPPGRTVIRDGNITRSSKQTEDPRKVQGRRVIQHSAENDIARSRNATRRGSTGKKPDNGNNRPENGAQRQQNGISRPKTHPRHAAASRKSTKTPVGKNGIKRQNVSKNDMNSNNQRVRRENVPEFKHERIRRVPTGVKM